MTRVICGKEGAFYCPECEHYYPAGVNKLLEIGTKRAKGIIDCLGVFGLELNDGKESEVMK